MGNSKKKLLCILLVLIMAVTMLPVQRASAQNEGAQEAGVEKMEALGERKSAQSVFDVTRDDGEKAPGYDINQPVIESSDFAENGKTLTVNDKLHFTMSAYDADSGIHSVHIYVRSKHDVVDGSVFLEKSGEGNLYTAEVSFDQLKIIEGDECYVSDIYVYDMVGNYVASVLHT